MGLSKYSSIVAMPLCEKPYPTILEFLSQRFSKISKEVWQERIENGKVLTISGEPITLATPYRPLERLRYFREVSQEPIIPFEEKILFQSKDILIADKPHFLPVTMGGPYVNECLLNRLRKKTGIDDLHPIHRIDRETAGIVMFSINPKTSYLYHDLFKKCQISKKYYALAKVKQFPGQTEWIVENRLEKGQPWFRRQVVKGETNARSSIKLLKVADEIGLFELYPITGKTHQLRIHISGLGFQILNDKYYPELQPKSPDNFEKPLQLIAKKLNFVDPVSKDLIDLNSGFNLQKFQGELP
jgi:tRNA pseudouridine32 synthase/23S rRNA pseudouridine746 synthase